MSNLPRIDIIQLIQVSKNLSQISALSFVCHIICQRASIYFQTQYSVHSLQGEKGNNINMEAGTSL